jgi:hypothetical protein
MLGCLGPGDVLTDCASPHSMRLIDNRGQPKDVVREAVGHAASLGTHVQSIERAAAQSRARLSWTA